MMLYSKDYSDAILAVEVLKQTSETRITNFHGIQIALALESLLRQFAIFYNDRTTHKDNPKKRVFRRYPSIFNSEWELKQFIIDIIWVVNKFRIHSKFLSDLPYYIDYEESKVSE